MFRRKCISGFSSNSTAEEVTEGIDGSGLTAIVTGATSGIGTETARVLALRSVHVVMVVENVVAAEKVREAIVKQHPSAKIDIMELDLSSFDSVRNFASDYKVSGFPLNILINNAGVMAPFQLSKDGIELNFATNHLGHFLLTDLLLETVKETAEESGKEGRIVVVSSCLHRLPYRGGIRFHKINSPSWYTTYVSYGQSKLANILHTNELARRLKDDEANVTVNSLHPGIVLDTNITSKNRTIPETNIPTKGKVSKAIRSMSGSLFYKTVQQGAATTCYVALHPQIKGLSGKYFVNSNLSTSSSLATNLDLAKKLWDFSFTLVNNH